MGLLSSTEIASLTGIYNSLFDTFKQEIIVIKEPIRSIVSNSSADLWKYGDTSNESNYTFTPVSGIFSGLVDNNINPKEVLLTSLEQKGATEVINIQVYSDFKNYVNNGVKVQSIIIKSKNYELISEDLYDPFLNLDVYQYKLKLIK